MKHLNPAKILALGYLFYSLVGWAILSLPICHKAPISAIDGYFTAISSVSTTGLSTIDIGTNYNLLGQIVILLLIQFGGIGYMTFSSFILLCTSGKLSSFRKKIGTSSFAFPRNFSVREFILSVVIFSFACEAIGAILLSIIFWAYGVDQYIWNGIFHSVSAFCTAGLSLFANGLVSFRYNIGLVLIISALTILGSLGFIVALDLYKKITVKDHIIVFTTKVITVITFTFLILGTVLFFLIEPLRGAMTPLQGWLIGFFQVVSAATTTGFNTIDMGTLSAAVLLLLGFLTTFGSAPSGTGGGLKNTPFATLIAFVKSTLKGKPTTLWNHRIPPKRVKIATVTFIYYIFCISLALFVLNISEDKLLLPIFFELINAINNSGFTMGLTSELTVIGKVVISLLMLIGRTGVLTFGIAISSQKDEIESSEKAELVL